MVKTEYSQFGKLVDRNPNYNLFTKDNLLYALDLIIQKNLVSRKFTVGKGADISIKIWLWKFSN
jgi:hypothetical protein